MKKLIIVFMALAIMFVSGAAFAQEEDKEVNIMSDILLLRPLGAASMAIGGVAYVISLPFALLTDSNDETFEVLVENPYKYTITRPVGKVTYALK